VRPKSLGGNQFTDLSISGIALVGVGRIAGSIA
jgi:hypothetical protein